MIPTLAYKFRGINARILVYSIVEVSLFDQDSVDRYAGETSTHYA